MWKEENSIFENLYLKEDRQEIDKEYLSPYEIQVTVNKLYWRLKRTLNKKQLKVYKLEIIYNIKTKDVTYKY